MSKDDMGPLDFMTWVSHRLLPQIYEMSVLREHVKQGNAGILFKLSFVCLTAHSGMWEYL